MPLNIKLDKNQTDEEILNLYTPEAMKSAVEKKLKTVHYAKFNSVQKFSAVAALLVIMIALPLLIKNVNYSKNKEIENSGIIYKGKKNELATVKSDKKAKFFIYKNEDSTPVLLKENDIVNEGDKLQISYQTTTNLQAMILSIDGQGNVTQHYPLTVGESKLIKTSSSQTPLLSAYELDDAKSYERFIMITSKKSFTSQKFLNAVSMMTAEEAMTADFYSFFPKDSKIESILLLK